jgi:aryl-alcohol dehydrogenase-like predicted oxidoreductase
MSSIFQPAPAPKTPLGYRRLLSPSAGIRVSPLCLGGMSLGEQWGSFVGEITKPQAFELLDAFYEAGGNFIDVANLYHFGDSERWVGEWMKERDNRDKIVLATKYSGWNDGSEKDINSMGNHTKSMALTVRDSLKRLQTDYIDIFYVHFWQVPSSSQSHEPPLNPYLLDLSGNTRPR